MSDNVTTKDGVSFDRFAIFSFLWSCATIFHLGKWNEWLHSPLSLLLGASAVYVLLKPSSVPRFTLLIAIQIADSFAKMPWIPNHWLFTALVNITMLLALVVLRASGKKSFGGSIFIRTFEPVVRTELILLYFLAFFHKLNKDWFNPDVSCGAKLYLLITGNADFLQGPLLVTVIGVYAALIIEIVIPVLLIIRRTRIAGIILALFYHFVLGVSEYYNFSAMMFALVFLFTPDNFADRLRAWWSGCRPRAVRAFITFALSDKVRTPALSALAIIAVALFIYTQMTEPPLGRTIQIRDPASYDKTRLYYVFLAFWLIYSIVLIYVFLKSVAAGKAVWENKSGYFMPGHKILLLIPLFVILNGASPYLGLKTQTSWSMFSNLRTENGEANHMIIGRPYYLTAYQTDLVEILSSADPSLQALSGTGYLIPYFELRYYVSEKTGGGTKPIRLSYKRGGVSYSVSGVKDDPEIFGPHNTIVRKLLFFRPVWSGNDNPCQQ